MTNDTEGAIATLTEGLQGDRQTSFPQADTLVLRICHFGMCALIPWFVCIIVGFRVGMDAIAVASV